MNFTEKCDDILFTIYVKKEKNPLEQICVDSLADEMVYNID
ncbi:MAG TPA: hypothetical protein VEG44_07400 [Candidatus Acidoferrales bacterium]|nr:hypothetical protein [Candidatus Acidoferrales bacterium]